MSASGGRVGVALRHVGLVGHQRLEHAMGHQFTACLDTFEGDHGLLPEHLVRVRVDENHVAAAQGRRHRATRDDHGVPPTRHLDQAGECPEQDDEVDGCPTDEYDEVTETGAEVRPDPDECVTDHVGRASKMNTNSVVRPAARLSSRTTTTASIASRSPGAINGATVRPVA